MILSGFLVQRKGRGSVVGLGDVSVDGRLKRDEGMEHAAFEPLLGELGEEALDRVHPRGRCRREVEREARMASEPLDHLGMLVGGIVVQDHVDQLAGGTSRSMALRNRMNSWCRWRCMQRPITLPSSTSSAANRVVVPWRL